MEASIRAVNEGTKASSDSSSGLLHLESGFSGNLDSYIVNGCRESLATSNIPSVILTASGQTGDSSFQVSIRSEHFGLETDVILFLQLVGYGAVPSIQFRSRHGDALNLTLGSNEDTILNAANNISASIVLVSNLQSAGKGEVGNAIQSLIESGNNNIHLAAIFCQSDIRSGKYIVIKTSNYIVVGVNFYAVGFASVSLLDGSDRRSAKGACGSGRNNSCKSHGANHDDSQYQCEYFFHCDFLL